MYGIKTTHSFLILLIALVAFGCEKKEAPIAGSAKNQTYPFTLILNGSVPCACSNYTVGYASQKLHLYVQGSSFMDQYFIDMYATTTSAGNFSLGDSTSGDFARAKWINIDAGTWTQKTNSVSPGTLTISALDTNARTISGTYSFAVNTASFNGSFNLNW